MSDLNQESRVNHFQVLLLAGVLLQEGCQAASQSGRTKDESMAEITTTTSSVTREDAIRISQEDAGKKYRDLSAYEIGADLKADGWHVDYQLKNKSLDGGGPHYLIDRVTGRILRRTYQQ